MTIRYKDLRRICNLEEDATSLFVVPGGNSPTIGAGHLAPYAIEDPTVRGHINSFLASYGRERYIDPKQALALLRVKLNTIGLDFSYDGRRKIGPKESFKVTLFGGRTGVDEKGKFLNDDGISHKNNGVGFLLHVTCFGEGSASQPAYMSFQIRAEDGSEDPEEVAPAPVNTVQKVPAKRKLKEGSLGAAKLGRMAKSLEKKQVHVKALERAVTTAPKLYGTRGFLKQHLDAKRKEAQNYQARLGGKVVKAGEKLRRYSTKINTTVADKVHDWVQQNLPPASRDKALATAAKAGENRIKAKKLAYRLRLRGQKGLHESLTKKHFKLVADHINSITDPAEKKLIAKHHAEIFAKANPRFDKGRFYKAAGVTETGTEIISDILSKSKPQTKASGS